MIRKFIDSLGFKPRERWQDVLPLQALRIVAIEDAAVDALPADEGLVTWRPDQWANSPLAALQKEYPSGSELKVGKWSGDPGEIMKTALTGNVLHLAEAGPRIYDAILLKGKRADFRAFVAHHDDGGRAAGTPESLLRQGVIVRTAGGQEDHSFENFALSEYGPWLHATALKAAEGTHFGNLDKKGRRFLYQKIPGVDLPAKRRVTERAALLHGLMEKAGVSVDGRLVLDVGCNLGLMMSQYLKFGAAWCHGWDFPEVVEHTETMLAALGCTRFSVTGMKIESNLPMREQLPDFLKSRIDGCVISYVAIRRHVGWLDELKEIPWSFLIYEGHKPDSQEDFARHIDELGRLAGCTAAATMWDCEKGSRPRPLAIFVRK